MLAFVKKRWLKRTTSILVMGCLLLSFAAPRFALRERAMVPMDEMTVRADVLSEDWLHVYMVEQEYDATQVTNINHYSITIADDPDCASPVKPTLIHHRHFQEYATYKENLG